MITRGCFLLSSINTRLCRVNRVWLHICASHLFEASAVTCQIQLTVLLMWPMATAALWVLALQLKIHCLPYFIQYGADVISEGLAKSSTEDQTRSETVITGYADTIMILIMDTPSGSSYSLLGQTLKHLPSLHHLLMGAGQIHQLAHNPKYFLDANGNWFPLMDLGDT